jgi:hypothetical protein
VSERQLISAYAAMLLLVVVIIVLALPLRQRRVDLGLESPGVEIQGLADPAFSGRPSIGNHGRIGFLRPLPREFTLRVSGRSDAAGPVDVAVHVQGGSTTVLRLDPSGGTYDARLENPWFASAVDWTLPVLPDSRTGAATVPVPRVVLSGVEILP